MTLSITHNKIATLPDQAGAEVNKAEWNDFHAIGGDLTGYTITVSQISDATIASGSSVSGSNTGDQTNITGNAATVTTIPNLSGPITSSGNTTSIAAQTGTGSTFVMQTAPSVTTLNVTGSTAPANGMYLSAANTLDFSTNSTKQLEISSVGGFTLGSISEASFLTLNTNLNGGIAVNSSQTNGPALSLNATGAGGHNYQFNSSAALGGFVVFDSTTACSPLVVYGGTGSGAGCVVVTLAGGVIGFNGAPQFTGNTCDTGISRISAAAFAFGNGAQGNTTASITAGNIKCAQAGTGLIVKSGSNARIGTGTLSGGTLTIVNTSVTANTRVFLQDTTSGALTNVGILTAVTTAGTGFVVTSTLALDTSTFNWLLVESA